MAKRPWPRVHKQFDVSSSYVGFSHGALSFALHGSSKEDILEAPLIGYKKFD